MDKNKFIEKAFECIDKLKASNVENTKSFAVGDYTFQIETPRSNEDDYNGMIIQYEFYFLDGNDYILGETEVYEDRFNDTLSYLYDCISWRL